MRVRYYGTVGLPTGYGAAANEFCMAMLAAGIHLEILTAATQLDAAYEALVPHIRSDENPPSPHPDIVIVHTLPLSCADVLRRAKVRETCPRAKLVAYTTWEGLRAPPELIESLAAFSQVWVPSHVTARAIDITERFKTKVIPHATDDRPFGGHAVVLGERPFRFYAIGAWTVRKNMEGVIRAYLRAFNKGDDVELLLHCQGAPDEAAAMTSVAATGKMPSDLPPIYFSTFRMTDAEIRDIHVTSDCFVSTSRGESWNLPAFDAMRAGNHIIATAGCGHEEFLADTSWDAIDGIVAPASGEVRASHVNGQVNGQYVGGDCLTVKQDWREPCIESAADLMAYFQAFVVRGGRLGLSRPGLSIMYDPRERFGRAAVGALIKQAIEDRS